MFRGWPLTYLPCKGWPLKYLFEQGDSGLGGPQWGLLQISLPYDSLYLPVYRVTAKLSTCVQGDRLYIYLCTGWPLIYLRVFRVIAKISTGFRVTAVLIHLFSYRMTANISTCVQWDRSYIFLCTRWPLIYIYLCTGWPHIYLPVYWVTAYIFTCVQGDC